jgi:hypothetical protein
MADGKDASQEAAKAFVEATLKQSELLGSWSLAVFGACIVLVAWYVQRRLDHPDRADVKALWLVFVCILLQGISILLMYFAYGTMVNIIPEAQFAKTETAEQFRTFLANMGFNNARYLFVCQFWSFFAGIVLIGTFGLKNVHLVARG